MDPRIGIHHGPADPSSALDRSGGDSKISGQRYRRLEGAAMRRLAIRMLLVLLAACSTSPPPVSRAAAQRALCADVAAPTPLMRRLLADADLFEQAGDKETAKGIRKLVRLSALSNAWVARRRQ
jgi:hypothetical protein